MTKGGIIIEWGIEGRWCQTEYTLNISCIALAGGKGSRLGRNKVAEIIGNESLLGRVASCLSYFEGDIIIVKAEEQSLPPLIDYPRLKIVNDIYPGKGPLGGVFTGLSKSTSLYNLVVAGDMPFLNRDLLQYMVKVCDGFDLVVPRLGALIEPLHAVYSRNCLAPIRRLLKQGNLQISLLISMLKVRYVEAKEIDRFDPEHLSFFNINTGADLETAREIAKKKHDKC